MSSVAVYDRCNGDRRCTCANWLCAVACRRAPPAQPASYAVSAGPSASHRSLTQLNPDNKCPDEERGGAVSRMFERSGGVQPQVLLNGLHIGYLSKAY